MSVPRRLQLRAGVQLGLLAAFFQLDLAAGELAQSDSTHDAAGSYPKTESSGKKSAGLPRRQRGS
jgi:hypothetical protein